MGTSERLGTEFYFESESAVAPTYADEASTGEYNITGASNNLSMDEASQRIQLGTEAGEVYVAKLESIRDQLDDIDNSGATLGTMVAAQLKMTEAETEYMVRAGLPKKVSSSVQAAANDVKKAAG
jgi:hypothetical protein